MSCTPWTRLPLALAPLAFGALLLSPAARVAPPAPPPPNIPIYGLARMIHAPTPCEVPAFSEGGPGVPYFVTEGFPRGGWPFHVQWSTKPTVPEDLPAWPAYLFVSFELMTPTPLDAVGAPGCYQLVESDFVMIPTAGGILTQQGGRVHLDWTPHPGLAGQVFYAQMMVLVPGVNAAGLLVSPALHVVIGE